MEGLASAYPCNSLQREYKYYYILKNQLTFTKMYAFWHNNGAWQGLVEIVNYSRFLRSLIIKFECFEKWRVHNLSQQFIPLFDDPTNNNKTEIVDLEWSFIFFILPLVLFATTEKSVLHCYSAPPPNRMRNPNR